MTLKKLNAFALIYLLMISGCTSMQQQHDDDNGEPLIDRDWYRDVAIVDAEYDEDAVLTEDMIIVMQLNDSCHLVAYYRINSTLDPEKQVKLKGLNDALKAKTKAVEISGESPMTGDEFVAIVSDDIRSRFNHWPVDSLRFIRVHYGHQDTPCAGSLEEVEGEEI